MDILTIAAVAATVSAGVTIWALTNPKLKKKEPQLSTTNYSTTFAEPPLDTTKHIILAETPKLKSPKVLKEGMGTPTKPVVKRGAGLYVSSTREETTPFIDPVVSAIIASAAIDSYSPQPDSYTPTPDTPFSGNGGDFGGGGSSGSWDSSPSSSDSSSSSYDSGSSSSYDSSSSSDSSSSFSSGD